MDTSRLDLNLLVTLEALLAERNVTKAAARLHLSQPAVSAQLARLRQAFGDPLLIPAQRGMTPSAKALELLAPLRQALDQVRQAVQQHQGFDPATAAMTATVACTDYLQAAVLAPLFLALRRQAPGLRVAVRQLDPAQLDAQMARGDVDLALLTPADAPPGLRVRHLFDETYVLIARRRHPKVGARLGVRDFARLDHVIVSPAGGGFRSPVDDALAARGLQRNVVLSAASFLFVPGIVAGSDLVALVPQRLVGARPAGLQVLPCPLPVAGFEVGQLWHERTHAHAGHQWLREQVLKVAAAP